MSKYDPLKIYLQKQTVSHITLRFSDIADILDTPLPDSAFRHREWWSNGMAKPHVQTFAWIDAGYETCVASDSLKNRIMYFQKI